MARGRPFKKGHPGGPGRPPGSKNGSSIAKEWAEKVGWKRLIQMAMGMVKGIPPTTQADLVKYLMDRAYGKPTAAHEIDLRAQMTLEQLVAGSRREDI